MAATEFFVAVARDESEVPYFTTQHVFCSDDTQRVTQELLSHRQKSILVLCLIDEQSSARKICKTLFPYFALSEKSSTSFTQFTILFVEGPESDLIQYRCERLSDIDAVVEEEDEMYTCASICATTVVPTEDTFDFDQSRLTIMACTEANYDTESLVAKAESCAIALGCRFSCVCVYVPATTMSSYNVDHLASISRDVQTAFHDKTIGRDERVSSQVKLQDVRAWTLLINERYHFSPVEHGPYFINLDPKLVVGEKLAHLIARDTSYIVGEGTNCSPLDFIALPPSETNSLEHRSVYSPHCRLRREGNHVWIRPECGVTYINGNLLAEERELSDNDRLILGKQLAFRFVQVELISPPAPGSRILDWELCAKEFREASKDVLKKSETKRLEELRDEVAKQNEALEKKLKSMQPRSYIIVHNPPPSYQGPILFPFDAYDPALSVSIGPEGSFTLPFLENTGSIERRRGNLVYVCGDAIIRLNHASRFIINNITFSVSVEDASTHPVIKSAASHTDSAAEEEDARQTKLSYFDLQWAIALLFDFAFPLKSKDKHKDEYRGFRKAICSDAIMKNEHLPLREMIEANQNLTNAVRMIGAGLAKEINGVYTGSPVSLRENTNEVSTTQTDFFKKVYKSSAWNPEQLKRLHKEIGTYLLTSPPSANGVDAAAKVTATSNLPKEASSATRPFGDKINELKGICSLAVYPVTSRATNVINILSVSANPKSLWEKYLAVTQELTRSLFSPGKYDESVEMQQNMILALVDLLFATDYCLRKEVISTSSLSPVEAEIDEWIKVATTCAGSFKEYLQGGRNNWSHEAAVQRKPTPRMRPAAVQPPGKPNLNMSTGGTVSPRQQKTGLPARRTSSKQRAPRDSSAHRGRPRTTVPVSGRESASVTSSLTHRDSFMNSVGSNHLRPLPTSARTNPAVSSARASQTMTSARTSQAVTSARKQPSRPVGPAAAAATPTDDTVHKKKPKTSKKATKPKIPE